ASGLPELCSLFREISSSFFTPAHDRWAVCPTMGNTDAWYKLCTLLCDPGDCILVEEYTYPAVLASSYPRDILPIAVPMDSQGMSPEHLTAILSEWCDRGTLRRPRLVYTVPIGQNPTGSVMGVQRKKDLLAVCAEYDLMLVEDDPYHFLNYSGNDISLYDSIKDEPFERLACVPSVSRSLELDPSFLKFDTNGRVIRLDSFSKTVAPGCRLGWITAEKAIVDRFMLLTEVSTQAPSGMSQALVLSLLSQRGMTGYLAWTQELRNVYLFRRDVLMRAISTGLAITVARNVCRKIWTVSAHRLSLFEFVPPLGGMFLWIKIHYFNHPTYEGKLHSGQSIDEVIQDLSQELWDLLAEGGVLVTQGSVFAPQAVLAQGSARLVTLARPSGCHYFRLSFSSTEVSASCFCERRSYAQCYRLTTWRKRATCFYKS
ncbi:pyridoxal phosphate-dependent transferase, partial [Vararia minispora EC-137]